MTVLVEGAVAYEGQHDAEVVDEVVQALGRPGITPGAALRLLARSSDAT